MSNTRRRTTFNCRWGNVRSAETVFANRAFSFIFVHGLSAVRPVLGRWPRSEIVKQRQLGKPLAETNRLL